MEAVLSIAVLLPSHSASLHQMEMDAMVRRPQPQEPRAGRVRLRQYFQLDAQSATSLQVVL